MTQTVFESRVRKFTSAPSYLLPLVLCIGYSSENICVNQYLSYEAWGGVVAKALRY